MPSPEAPPDREPGAALPREEQLILLRVARDSIRHGLEKHRPLSVDPAGFPDALQALRASFVTLHRHGQLRGCIGQLEATQPLVADVAEHAYAAAFHDPRFPPLRDAEYADLHIDISVLSVPEPLSFDSEQDLLARIRPGRDGLILEDGIHRGTFLPSVWESLSDPIDFLRQLKIKAGLPPHFWSARLRVSRYQTESFS